MASPSHSSLGIFFSLLGNGKRRGEEYISMPLFTKKIHLRAKEHVHTDISTYAYWCVTLGTYACWRVLLADIIQRHRMMIPLLYDHDPPVFNVVLFFFCSKTNQHFFPLSRLVFSGLDWTRRLKYNFMMMILRRSNSSIFLIFFSTCFPSFPLHLLTHFYPHSSFTFSSFYLVLLERHKRGEKTRVRESECV